MTHLLRAPSHHLKITTALISQALLLTATCAAAWASGWQLEQKSEAAGDYSLTVEKDRFSLLLKKCAIAIVGSQNKIIVIDNNKKTFVSKPAREFKGLDQDKVLDTVLRDLSEGKVVSDGAVKFKSWKAEAYLNHASGNYRDDPCTVKAICLDEPDVCPEAVKVVCLLNLACDYKKLPVAIVRQDGFPNPRLITSQITRYNGTRLSAPNLKAYKQVKAITSYSVSTDPDYVKDLFGF